MNDRFSAAKAQTYSAFSPDEKHSKEQAQTKTDSNCPGQSQVDRSHSRNRRHAMFRSEDGVQHVRIAIGEFHLCPDISVLRFQGKTCALGALLPRLCDQGVAILSNEARLENGKAGFNPQGIATNFATAQF